MQYGGHVKALLAKRGQSANLGVKDRRTSALSTADIMLLLLIYLMGTYHCYLLQNVCVVRTIVLKDFE